MTAEAVFKIGDDYLNEVHEFMAKFRQDVETKWGLATDSTLGSKVKITLLATGFGLQSINGIGGQTKDKDLTDEEAEKEERQQVLIDKYYNGENAPVRSHKHNIFIFNAENIDDDEIISRVDTIPTCRRSKEDLKHICGEAI